MKSSVVHRIVSLTCHFYRGGQFLEGYRKWLVLAIAAVALSTASYGGVRTVSAAIDNLTDGFTITLGEASGTTNTVFAAYGATDAGTTPSAWEHVARVGVVAAEDSTISFAPPKEWESSAHAIRFFAVDGTFSGDLPVEYVSGEDANVSFPLNYVPKADTRTQIKFMYTHHNGSTFFGTPYGTAEASDYRFFQGGDNAIAYFDMGLSGQRILQADVLTDPAVIRHFELGNHYIKDLDTDTTIVSAESAEDLTGYASALQLFAGGDYGRVYSLKIYEGETLKLDLVPYMKDDGTPAFRDALTGDFYMASGTGVVGMGVPIALLEGAVQSSAAIEDAVSAAPVYTDFEKRLRVTPTGSAVVATGVEYSNVPVLLRLSTSITGFSYSDFTRGGKDMLILDEASNVLPFEIETWNPSGESLVWVKVPTYSENTRINVYYGDKQGRRNGANDPKQVWSAYAGVWHLDELGTEITLADSSPNGYDGKTYNVSEGLSGGVLGNYARNIDKRSQSGQGGLYFEGTKNIAHGGKLTLSAWVKRYQLNSCWDHLFYSKTGSSQWGGFASELYGQSGAWGKITLIGGGSNGQCVRSDHGFAEADTWYHIVVTYDGYEAFYYNNGVKLGGGTMLEQPMWSNGQRFSLGNDNDLNGSPWDGAFDEFRVSVGAMSPERIALEYALMQSGAMEMAVTDNAGERLQFGDVSLTSNGDGTFAVSAEITAGSASSVKVVLTDGTEVELAPSGATAPWSVSAQTVSGVTANTSFMARLHAADVSGDDVWVPVEGSFYSGTISIAAAADALEENLTPGEFVFSRAEGAAATEFPLVVNYIVSGSATAGVDYETLSGTVTISAGESSARVAVMPRTSPYTDGDVVVVASVAAGEYTSGSSSAALTIRNARNAGVLRFAKSIDLTLKQDVDAFTEGKNITGFPVLVRLSESIPGFFYSDIRRADHGDIAFYDADYNMLPYEIETWNPEGESRIWVKVDSLTPDLTLHLCYGADSAVANDPTAVWSAYSGVWHLYGAGDQEAYPDSTSNRIGGVKTAGRILVTDPSGTIIRGARQYLTVSVWLKPSAIGNWQWIVDACQSEQDGRWGLQFTSGQQIRFWNDGGKEPRISTPSGSVAAGEWVRFDCVYDGGNDYLYVNGTLAGTLTGQSWANGQNRVGDSFAIGGLVDTSKDNNLSTAEFGETRFVVAAQPAEWFKATYAFESRSGSCFDFGEVAMHAPMTAPAVGSASLATVDGKQMVAVPLEGGEGQLYVVVRDSLGNVTTNAVTDGIVSAGTYYYPVSSLPVNLVYEVGTYAVGAENKTDSRKYSVSARNGKSAKISLRVTGYTGENPVANFPALVRLSEGVGGFSYRKLTDEGATAGDIHFQDASGNELPFDVDTWNPDGESLFWVKLPLLSKGAKIFLVYGVEYTPGTDADELRASVWSGQTGVWHLDYDSTVYFGNSAQTAKTTLRAWQNGTTYKDENGIVGVSRRISTGGQGGTGGNAIVASNSDLLDLGDNFTVSAWIKYPKDQAPGWDRIISRKNAYNSSDGWEITTASGNPSNIDVRGGSQTSGGAGFFSSPVNDGNWHHVTAVYNDASVSLYENGVYRLAVDIGKASNNDYALSFGNNASQNEVPFKGWLDEIRLGAGSLSADRIKADYETVANNQFFKMSAYVPGFAVIVR